MIQLFLSIGWRNKKSERERINNPQHLASDSACNFTLHVPVDPWNLSPPCVEEQRQHLAAPNVRRYRAVSGSRQSTEYWCNICRYLSDSSFELWNHICFYCCERKVCHRRSPADNQRIIHAYMYLYAQVYTKHISKQVIKTIYMWSVCTHIYTSKSIFIYVFECVSFLFLFVYKEVWNQIYTCIHISSQIIHAYVFQRVCACECVFLC